MATSFSGSYALFFSMGLCKTNCVKNENQQLAQLDAKNQEIIETEAPDVLSWV
jgi:hypothetical protein